MADVTAKVQDAQKTIDLNKKTYTVELTTSKGPIRLQFFQKKAPGHVKNFVALAKIGYYNNLLFHRVIADFMIQGGCPEGSGSGGPGYRIDAEFNDTKHEPGVLSMARTGDPNSAGSQFFLCLATVGHLDGKYTAFGKTADDESLKTVLAIGAVKTNASDRPLEPVKILKAEVKEK